MIMGVIQLVVRNPLNDMAFACSYCLGINADLPDLKLSLG